MAVLKQRARAWDPETFKPGTGRGTRTFRSSETEEILEMFGPLRTSRDISRNLADPSPSSAGFLEGGAVQKSSLGGDKDQEFARRSTEEVLQSTPAIPQALGE